MVREKSVGATSPKREVRLKIVMLEMCFANACEALCELSLSISFGSVLGERAGSCSNSYMFCKIEKGSMKASGSEKRQRISVLCQGLGAQRPRSQNGR